jgi:DNA repair exonuclease SbcCD nuclease subunit
MIRAEKIKRPDAILTADWHLREDTPICYLGDYQSDQWEAVDFIANLQAIYKCPVLCSGDLFDHWKPSPYLLSKAIEHLPDQFYTVYGNHDLPQHNLELAHKSGIYTLEQAKVLSTEPPIDSTIDFCSWNQLPHQVEPGGKLLWHVFNWQAKLPWPGCTDASAASLLRKYPYDLIVTGDNHKPFVEEYKGRILVNPGSLMRMDADQIDHKPRIYLWYADTNTVEPVYIPIKDGVISREHLEVKEERDKRIEAFVSQLNGDWKASVTFEENLEIFERENKVKKPIMELVYKSLETIGK